MPENDFPDEPAISADRPVHSVRESGTVPLRAPQRWFKCLEYAPGLRIELPYPDEASAVEAGIAHLRSGLGGTVKVGFYGFRSRVIVYTPEELRDLSPK